MIQPNRQRRNVSLPRVAALTLVTLFAGLAAPQETPSRQRAFDLYDAGRYGEALPLLERLAEASPDDGVAHYRLYYCQRAAGDPRSAQTLERATSLLENAAAGGDLETLFYLASAYGTLGRAADARSVAERAVKMVEEGGLPDPTPMSMFRLGRLYAGQERAFEAADWYRRSLDGFLGQGTEPPRPYVQLAARYVGDQAFDDERYEEAALQYGRLVEHGGGNVRDLDRLAMARVRIGRYAEANQAWNQALRMNPAEGNRPRYCARLAFMADRLGGLPELAPGDRAWDALERGELESLLREQAVQLSKIIAGAQEKTPAGEEYTKLRAEVDAIQGVFVAGALEYALRGHNVRELAFTSGYAALVFHDRVWKLPGQPGGRGKGKGKAKGKGKGKGKGKAKGKVKGKWKYLDEGREEEDG